MVRFAEIMKTFKKNNIKKKKKKKDFILYLLYFISYMIVITICSGLIKTTLDFYIFILGAVFLISIIFIFPILRE